jgi:hypothetical protein|nr:MAG TPA: hypothetical protein [Crassvirales sp.]
MKIYIGKEENPISATEFVDKIFSPNKEGLRKQKEGWVAWINRDKYNKSITLDNIEHSKVDNPLDLDVNVRPYLVYKDGHTTNVGKRVWKGEISYSDEPTFEVVRTSVPIDFKGGLRLPQLLFKEDNGFRYKILKSVNNFTQVKGDNNHGDVLQVTISEFTSINHDNKEDNPRVGYYTLLADRLDDEYIKSIAVIHTSKDFSGIDIKLEEGIDYSKAINHKRNIDKTAFRNKFDVVGKPYHMNIKFYKDFKFDPNIYEFMMEFVEKTKLQKIYEKSKSGKMIVEKEYYITCNKVSPTKIEFVVDITNPEVGLYRLYNNDLRLLDKHKFYRALKFITPEFRIVETGNF